MQVCWQWEWCWETWETPITFPGYSLSGLLSEGQWFCYSGGWFLLLVSLVHFIIIFKLYFSRFNCISDYIFSFNYYCAANVSVRAILLWTILIKMCNFFNNMLRNRKGWMPPVLPHKHFFFLPDFFLLCLSSQLLHKKRHCVFHMDRVTTNSLKNQKYQAAGSVNGSVQVCENTSCCVGYFQVLNSQPVVHFLGKKNVFIT